MQFIPVDNLMEKFYTDKSVYALHENGTPLTPL